MVLQRTCLFLKSFDRIPNLRYQYSEAFHLVYIHSEFNYGDLIKYNNAITTVKFELFLAVNHYKFLFSQTYDTNLSLFDNDDRSFQQNNYLTPFVISPMMRIRILSF